MARYCSGLLRVIAVAEPGRDGAGQPEAGDAGGFVKRLGRVLDRLVTLLHRQAAAGSCRCCGICSCAQDSNGETLTVGAPMTVGSSRDLGGGHQGIADHGKEVSPALDDLAVGDR